MLEMIKHPFHAVSGEIKEVNDAVGIDLEKHGVAEFVIEADPVEQEEQADDPTPVHSSPRRRAAKH